jgi:hypothetical protein
MVEAPSLAAIVDDGGVACNTFRIADLVPAYAGGHR